MFYVKNKMVSILTEAVKPSSLLPLMILQNVLTRVANVMFFFWTLVLMPFDKVPQQILPW